MHLLSAKPGGYADDEGITYVAQTPGDIVILSAQDTDIALLANAASQLPDVFPSVRLTSLLYLRQHASVDLYLDDVLQHATVVLVSLLGGSGYWRYGLEQLEELAQRKKIRLLLIPGDDHPDEELARRSNVPNTELHRIWRYLREGGPANAKNLFHFIGGHYFFRNDDYTPPKPLPRVMIYHPDKADAALESWQSEWQTEQGVALLLFYRAHLQSGNTRAIDGIIRALLEQRINPLPIAVASLKDEACLGLVNHLAIESGCKLILNTTGFSLSTGSDNWNNPFHMEVPVFQVILSGSSREDWEENSLGLRPSDLAMNVVLPEMDGRIITRAVSFKGLDRHDQHTECDVVSYQLMEDRAVFVACLAANWIRLAETPNSDKRIALILANYPTKDGRIGNGVGLDTPASTLNILRAMAAEGYPLEDIPDTGTALIKQLLEGVTNDTDSLSLKQCNQSISLDEYQEFFNQLPEQNRQAILNRWGSAGKDPRVRNNRIMIPGIRLGETFIGIQPARGYNLDISASYHDPDLVPPHGYLAFYFWLTSVYGVQAVIHVGKHGNLEWLPGKGNALSAGCWPEAIFGPTPHFYPFIVNDPGEGAQAKRRTQAVIIDHLVPPLTRAETYGDLLKLEQLVDEYYQAQHLDNKRSEYLKKKIIQAIFAANLDKELGFNRTQDDENSLLTGVDAYLCELKEAQIRYGLHILGELPGQQQIEDTLLAMLRLPRGNRQSQDRGLLHALCLDLELPDEFNPLQPDMALPWKTARPAMLDQLTEQPWRTQGDTRERLELLAARVISGNQSTENLPATAKVIEFLHNDLMPRYKASATDEIKNLMRGLEGAFVPPGSSGAPSRGRLDVLPTGRNFYTVDNRGIPTATAWELGWRSANALIDRYLQEHGDYPERLGLSVWGTATMRTGGDDIAQAMALLGVRPVWAGNSGRVIDFEILPATLLDRPRVDVTLRISGFFRDAFMNVVRLFDAAVRAVSELDEPADINPVRARILAETKKLSDQGLNEEEAKSRAGFRIFGSKPGAYGAGLQGLIDERCWENTNDLAEAYLNWGGYAYGQQVTGAEAKSAFQERLSNLQLVVQNQDNREHDILDSDDYYQFQGGMTAAVRSLSGENPSVYHADHANPANPHIRTLQEELSRVIRSRVVNPKWIEGIKRHGYKGVFEMAATVDYLFAYDATTHMVRDHQYEMVSDAYLLDEETRAFLDEHNPNALQEMTERMIEAMQRGLWQNPGNYRKQLEQLLLETEEGLEGN